MHFEPLPVAFDSLALLLNHYKPLKTGVLSKTHEAPSKHITFVNGQQQGVNRQLGSVMWPL